MSYDSVDKLQNLLASEVFHYTNDRKKAAGRALGTFVELITYYVIKNWNLEYFTAIECSLPEFANNEITHNVEFTLHGNRVIADGNFNEEDFPLSCRTIIKRHFDVNEIASKGGMVIEKQGYKKCVCFSFKRRFVYYCLCKQ